MARATGPTRWAARTLLVAGVLLGAAATGLIAMDAEGILIHSFVLAMTGFVVAGSILADRRPANPVGWCLAVYGVSAVLAQTATEYALRGATRGWPALDAAGWWGAWTWALGLPFLGIALLRFPDGDLLGRRWIWSQRAGQAAVALVVVIGALLWPSRGPELSAIADPKGFPGSAGTVWSVGWWLVFVAPVSGALALVFRYRHSGDLVRTQIRWVVYPALLVAAGILGFALTGAPGVDAHPLAELLAIGGFFGIPIAIAVAVLRYRLYEIDRLVSRTLAYAGTVQPASLSVWIRGEAR